MINNDDMINKSIKETNYLLHREVKEEPLKTKVILELPEMPYCCFDCNMAIQINGKEKAWCVILKEFCKNEEEERNFNCPLKEIISLTIQI